MSIWRASAWLAASLIFGLTACGGGFPAPENTPSAVSEAALPTVQATPAEPATVTPGSAISSTPAPGPQVLQIWLPPEFDPGSGSPAGDALQAHLDEFVRRRAGVRIEVRVKAVDGPGGLLDALTSASAAAPLILPDLIALSRPMLETAALKGLLHPYEGLSTAFDQPDWYEYARQLGRIQASTYGLPFAGDARVLVYRPEAIPELPEDWQAMLDLTGPLIFPAASSRALFTLGQYQAAGGAVQDEQGRPRLDRETLEEVLGFYRTGQERGSLPFWLAQFETDEQAWESYQSNQSNLVETSLRYFLQAEDPASQVGVLFSRDGEPLSLATGWVWALASARSDHLDEGAALAEYLVDPVFLARWSEAGGFLPTRRNALAGWEVKKLAPILEQIALSGSLEPGMDVMLEIGPALQAATLQILKDQVDPRAAAQAAVDSLGGP